MQLRTYELRAGGRTNRDFVFKMKKFPTFRCRRWRGAIGTQRAKRISFVDRAFQGKFCYCNHYKLNLWMSRALEDRKGRLRGNVDPGENTPI